MCTRGVCNGVAITYVTLLVILVWKLMYCILMLCTNMLSVSACVKVCACDALTYVTTVICQLLFWRLVTIYTGYV